MAFRDGEAVSHFLGAIPESQVRAFLDGLIPSPSELERARARDLREAGDATGAAAALRKAIELDARNDEARLDLAELLIGEPSLDEAGQILGAVEAHPDRDARIASLKAALGFARAARSGGGEPELRARLGRDAADHDARLALASLHAGHKRYRQAMDELLEIVRADKAWKSGEARKQLLAIFNLAEGEPDLVSEYRRKLASALN
jgi:putative thioredoxin